MDANQELSLECQCAIGVATGEQERSTPACCASWPWGCKAAPGRDPNRVGKELSLFSYDDRQVTEGRRRTVSSHGNDMLGLAVERIAAVGGARS